MILVPSCVLSQWVSQQLPAGISMLHAIDFSDINSGISAGYYEVSATEIRGKAIYTTNSGLNWHSAVIPDSVVSIGTVNFINNSTALASADYGTLAKTEYPQAGKLNLSAMTPFAVTHSVLLISTNSGQSWNIRSEFPSSALGVISMRFLTPHTGVAVVRTVPLPGEGSSVIKTTDGGYSWFDSYLSPDAGLSNIYCFDSLRYFVAGGGFPAVIARTTNGGTNWTSLEIQNTGIYDISFMNSLTGICSGNHLGATGKILKTTDGGNIWFDDGVIYEFSYFINVEMLFGTGDGIITGAQTNIFGEITSLLIKRTSNGGETWTDFNQTTSFNLLVNSRMIDRNYWFASGGLLEAKMFRTSNGGVTFENSVAQAHASTHRLNQNFPNPFNPESNIVFEMSNPGFVMLKVFDTLGKEVRVLVSGNKDRGSHSVRFESNDLPSGIYFYSLLIDGEVIDTKSMILMK